MSEDLKRFIKAAEARGDMNAAKLAMVKLRDSMQPGKNEAPLQTSHSEPEPKSAETYGIAQYPRAPVRKTQMIRELPELPASGLLSGEDKTKTASISPTLLATADPQEQVDIITANFPNVAVTYDKDAQGDVFPILTNRETGAKAIVNKPGLSGMDVLQGLGLAAAFTPAGRASSAVGAGAKAALTQGAVEGAQVLQGGDVDPLDIGVAAAGGVAGQQIGKKLAQVFSGGKAQQFIDPQTQLPTKEFNAALKAKGMDAGDLVDDIDSGLLPKPTDNQSPKQYLNDIVADKLQRGEATASMYNLQLKNGKVIKNSDADEALKQGFSKGQIAGLPQANGETKAAMRKMARLKRSIQANDRVALDKRPTNIVGDEAMKRVNVLRGRANGLRKDLNSTAESQLKGLNIDKGGIDSRFKSALNDLEVEIDPEEGLVFTDSLVSEDGSAQRVIKAVSRLLEKKDGNIDAKDAHNIKRQLDNMIDFQKKEYGLTDTGNRVAKDIRSAVNDAIRDVSPDYAKINDDLSLAISKLSDFGDALGSSTDLYSETAASSVGQKLRRLLSNAESRTNIDATLAAVEDAATKLGGEFKTDLKQLVSFNKTLDDRFGATARGSFQGEIESAMRSGPVAAAKNFAAKKAMDATDELRGISESAAFDVLEKMLRN